MSDSKKVALPVGDATGKAEAGADTRQDTTSTNDFTTSPSSRQRAISDFLGCGQGAAVTLQHIKQMVNLPGREIRRQIQMERQQHIPIVSDRHGYYLAENNREKDRFVRGMKRRAAEIVKVAEAVEEAEIGGE